MSIRNLPWHDAVIDRLAAMHSTQQLPHALALTSSAGWGLEHLLDRAARLLLEVDDAHAAAELAHQDLRWIEPDEGLISVDTIRQINEFAVRTALTAPRKVAVIMDAHLLNASASNALLKTLEEPPPDTHLLIGTHAWGRMLPTIRSRCVHLHAGSDLPAALSWLEQQGNAVSAEAFAEMGYAPLQQAQIEAGAVKAWVSGLKGGVNGKVIDQALDADTSEWLARWYRLVVTHIRTLLIQSQQDRVHEYFTFAQHLLDTRRLIGSVKGTNARLQMEYLIARWLQLPDRP